MNLNFLRKYSPIASQVFKSRYYFHSLNCPKRIYFVNNHILSKNKFRVINQTVYTKCYSTSVYALICGQISPLIALVLGRVIYTRWPHLRYNGTNSILKVISVNKSKSFTVFSLMIAIILWLSERYSEETPFTRRKRIVIFNKKDYEPISEMLFELLIKLYKDKLLSVDHRTTKRVHQIVKHLLESNQEFEEITDKNWEVFVIKDSKTANAFVLPTGQIFVYTGIVKLTDNDSQLGTILAHELSHTLLGHGKEIISRELMIDFIHSLIVFFFWIRFNGMKAMFGTLITGLSINSILLLPKRRLIEMEADFMGLVLSAKTCYDVREGSAFWKKMSSNVDPKLKSLLSTHPSNRLRYEAMDSYMPSMIRLMESIDCPKLSETDPRNRVTKAKTISKRTVFQKKK